MDLPPPLPTPPRVSVTNGNGFKGVCRDSFTPIRLHFAVNKNDINEVRSLIEKHIDLDYMVFGQTPLAVSIYKEQYDIACLLVDSGASLSKLEKSKWLRLPIHLAACSGNIDLVTKMLNRAPDSVHARDAIKFTPLHWAAAMGHLEVVKLLLAKNSAVNALDDMAKTPLHWAAENERKDVVLCLLNGGANVNLQDKFGWTPIFQPVLCFNTDLVELLLVDGKLDINLRDSYGNTALHASCNPKSDNNLFALCQSNLDITTRHLNASTPNVKKIFTRMPSSQSDHIAIVLLLLNYGADYNIKANNGESALSVAAKFGLEELVIILLNAGCNIYAENYQAWKSMEGKMSRELVKTIVRIAQECGGVFSLKKLCKISIRKYVRVKKDDNIHQLPLPNFLVNYILLSYVSIDE